MGNYIYWKESINVEVISNERIFLYVDRYEGKFEQYAINDSALEILETINGVRTLEQTYNYFQQKYEESFEKVKKNIDNFICELEKSYGIHLAYQEKPQLHSLEVKKVNIYPKVVSIELTDFCNLACKHCYGTFCMENRSYIPLDKVKELLYELDECNAFMIELTGGECLTHPDFCEILKYALSLKFKQIAILSNGVAFTTEIFEVIKANRERVSIQIDMHSLNEEYLDWFTGKTHIMERVKKNICLAVATGAPTRVVSIITKRNLKELESLAAWAYEIGATSYAISPVVPLGRAIEYDMDLILEQQESELMMERLGVLASKYSEMMRNPLVEAPNNQMINCGCISSHLTIKSNGDVKMCTMDCGDCTNSKFGNVLEQGVKKLYDEHQRLIYAIAYQQVPNINSEQCKKCKNFTFCVSCMLRTVLKASEEKENCYWYQNELSPLIKEAFFG